MKLKNHRRPLSVTFPNDKCNLVNFPRGRSYPSSTFVIVSYMCAATHLDFGFFVYLECSNFQITGQENNDVLYILQFLKCCSLEPPPRKTLYVWPPETPNQASCSSARLVNASKTPNKHLKIRFDWSKVYWKLLGNAN